MKVKALCNIIYGGILHSCGDIFEADRAIPNTRVIEPDIPKERERPDESDLREERERAEDPDTTEENEREAGRGRGPRRR